MTVASKSKGHVHRSGEDDDEDVALFGDCPNMEDRPSQKELLLLFDVSSNGGAVLRSLAEPST